jgi:predicted SprT family Zn-dependent metalloprotease
VDLSDAHRLATALMTEHSLDGWTLVFDSARTRAGVCRFDRRQIGLSRHLTALHPEAEVTETILHEIAHALVGPGHGHDALWRATARRIGGSGRRCLPEDAPRVEGGWVGECPAGHRRTAHRRPRRVRSCAECSPVFDPDAVFVWTRRGVPAPMHPDYEAELSRLRAGARPAGHQGVGVGGVPRGAAAVQPRVGERVRLRGRGKYGGLVGSIEARGRTRFRVRTEKGLVSAPFALVEPLQPDGDDTVVSLPTGSGMPVARGRHAVR